MMRMEVILLDEEYLSVSGNDSGMDFDSFTESDIDIVDNIGESAGDTAVPDISSGDSYDMGTDRFDGVNSGYGSLDVSGNGYGVVDIDNQLLSSIRDEITALNAILFLVFMFLLLSWTEKKFSVIVNRFTRERK